MILYESVRMEDELISIFKRLAEIYFILISIIDRHDGGF